MKNIFKDVSASTVQVLLNQCLGLIIFLVISRYLDKSVYGELNWSLAVLTFSTTILSLRLEQIVVQKVAVGENSSKILTLFTAHIVVSGVLYYLLLLVGSLLFPSFFTKHSLLLILGISHLLSFFSFSFKQLANGKEDFTALAYMSSITNIIRAVWILWVIIFSTLTIRDILLIYILSSLAELIICIYLAYYKIGVSLSLEWSMAEYRKLIRESLPQIGVVFLNASIARFDWILLGLLSTSVITAEYSFAYKIFELSPIPMLILAPILLSRFSKYFNTHNETALLERKEELKMLVRFEMIVATILPLILNIIWVPLLDWLTDSKYGRSNESIFFILSLAVPFLYLINLFWTINFAQNRLSLIFKVSSVTCLIIIIGDSIMIPLMAAKGAAIIYLVAIVTECFLFFRISILSQIKGIIKPLIYCFTISLVSGFFAHYLSFPVIVKLASGVLIYGFLLAITGIIKKSDLLFIRQFWLNKHNDTLIQFI